MKTLNELFHHARYCGSDDARALVAAWDALTGHSPEFVIDAAEEQKALRHS
jgi:hypothetical protein